MINYFKERHSEIMEGIERVKAKEAEDENKKLELGKEETSRKLERIRLKKENNSEKRLLDRKMDGIWVNLGNDIIPNDLENGDSFLTELEDLLEQVEVKNEEVEGGGSYDSWSKRIVDAKNRIEFGRKMLKLKALKEGRESVDAGGLASELFYQIKEEPTKHGIWKSILKKYTDQIKVHREETNKMEDIDYKYE